MGSIGAKTSGKMAANENISTVFRAFWIVRPWAATRSKSRRRLFLLNKAMVKEGCWGNQRLCTVARKCLVLAWAKTGECVLTKGVKVWTRTEYAVCFITIYFDVHISLLTLRSLDMLLSSWWLLPRKPIEAPHNSEVSHKPKYLLIVCSKSTSIWQILSSSLLM